MRDIARRLAALESRRPPKPRRIVIVGSDQSAPDDADFVIRIVPAPMPGGQHA